MIMMGEQEPKFWEQSWSSNELGSSERRQPTEAERLIIHKYSGGEISRLSREVKVNTRANTPFSTPGKFNLFHDGEGRDPDGVFQQLVRQSGTVRVIDLGSSTTMLRATEHELRLLKGAGIKEYVGIDLGVEGIDWFEHPLDRKSAEGAEKLKCKYIQAEFLSAIHSLPDNYSNAWMTGIESDNVIQNYNHWGFALLSELKRVTPKNGFIFTDEGFINSILAQVPEYTDFRNNFKQKNKESLQKWETQENDRFVPASLAYVVDMPTIGLRAYVSKQAASSMGAAILLVNTEKRE